MDNFDKYKKELLDVIVDIAVLQSEVKILKNFMYIIIFLVSVFVWTQILS